ncbi:related to CSN12 - signalosome component [Cephalotrichum gorgonifer]|uniref:Protein CSN12 homolog n=1 Tax=Cephalotrichum gorgonifer TaxID=2041049 RepID=A0AAE8MWR5_9PEZI|nr:related to CSN12 - signalosome component [Cephalotrichum gorgonifer]
MDKLAGELATAHSSGNGYLVAQILLPIPPPDNPDRLRSIWKSTNSATVRKDVSRSMKKSSYLNNLPDDEFTGWLDILCAYWKALSEIVPMLEPADSGKTPSWSKVYETWKELTSFVVRGYTNHGFEAWTLPCLYVMGKHLRLYAMKSDEEKARNPTADKGLALADDFDPEMEKSGQLRDSEQMLKRIFTLCLSDRSPLEESRKWGIYFVINLLFKTYFKLNSVSLSKTILKALSAYQGDMPPLENFPKAQRVTFKYYAGVLAFLEENYQNAEEHLMEAWQLCHKAAVRNKEKILTYLIPCCLLTSHKLPTKELLEPYPKLQKMFLPLAQCIRRGDLHSFDVALQEGEDEFVRLRIYLALERSRDIAMRNLFRKVFVAGGFEEPKEPAAAVVRRTRIPIAEFQAAINLKSDGDMIDTDEVECFLANLIYKNLMKGYIARERGMVVLSKNGAFPGTGV